MERVIEYHTIMVTITADDIIPLTRKTYSDPLEVGEYLMAIDIGEDIIAHRFSG